MRGAAVLRLPSGENEGGGEPRPPLREDMSPSPLLIRGLVLPAASLAMTVLWSGAFGLSQYVAISHQSASLSNKSRRRCWRLPCHPQHGSAATCPLIRWGNQGRGRDADLTVLART
jgi:hypothetical protein